MKTAKKVSVILAVFMISGGLVLSTAGYAMLGGDLTKLNSMPLVQNTYTVEEDFENIHIDSSGADVQFAPSKNGKCYVDCTESDNVRHTVEVKNNTLNIKLIDNRKWYEHIGIFWSSMKVTVYLTKEKYDSLYIRTASGDIDIPSQYCFNDAELYSASGDAVFFAKVKNELKAKASSGSIFLRGIKPKYVTAESSSGDVSLSSVEAKGTITANTKSGDLSLRGINCKKLIANTSSGDTDLTSTEAGSIECKSVSGDIELRHCDAKVLKFNTSSGDVKGTLSSDKIFTTDTSSGSVKVPKTTTGGICEITTVSGDIRITIDN